MYTVYVNREYFFQIHFHSINRQPPMKYET